MTHRAMVVRSVRIDGKPRQKVILYLGTIHDRELWDPRLRKEWLEQCFERVDRSDATRGRGSATLKTQLIRAVGKIARGRGAG